MIQDHETSAESQTMTDALPSGDRIPEGDVELEKTRLFFKNAGMASISGDILFLSLFTIVLMTIAILTFKRTL